MCLNVAEFKTFLTQGRQGFLKRYKKGMMQFLFILKVLLKANKYGNCILTFKRSSYEF